MTFVWAEMNVSVLGQYHYTVLMGDEYAYDDAHPKGMAMLQEARLNILWMHRFLWEMSSRCNFVKFRIWLMIRLAPRRSGRQQHIGVTRGLRMSYRMLWRPSGPGRVHVYVCHVYRYSTVD